MRNLRPMRKENTKKIKILFINPSSMPYREMVPLLDKTSILRNPSFSMPIGLIDLAGYVREKVGNVEIKIIDIGKDLHKIYMNRDSIPAMSIEEFIGLELDQINFQPDILGISISFSSSHISSMKIIDQAKRKWKKSVVICGGNHATNCVRILLSNPNIDCVLRGEGELSFSQFVEKFVHGSSPADVYGIIDKNKLRNEPDQISPMLQDLDQMPMPAYDLLDMDTYRKSVGASIMFTRGCAFQCTFCATRTVHGSKVRFKSNARIIREFMYLVVKQKFRTIVIEDDLFAARKDQFIELAKEVMDLESPLKFRLPQGLSVATLDEEIIDTMVQMGIDEASLAIESGSAYTQKYIIKKNLSFPKARRILKYLRQKNFFIYVNFIFGFCGETRELIQESIDFINSLDVDWTYIFHALPLPGSEMFKKFESRGIVSLDNFDWDGIRLGRRTFDTPEIKAEELENLVYDTNIEYNFFNNSNLRHGRYKKAIDIFNRVIVDPYPFHIVGRYCRGLAYLNLKEQDKAEEDFRRCIEWINKNEESKRLYERYGNRMLHLKQYLDKANISIITSKLY